MWRQKSSRQPRGKCLLVATGAVRLGFPQGAHSARGRGVCGRGEGVPLAWSLEVGWGVINPSPCPSHKGALATAVTGFLLGPSPAEGWERKQDWAGANTDSQAAPKTASADFSGNFWNETVEQSFLP